MQRVFAAHFLLHRSSSCRFAARAAHFCQFATAHLLHTAKAHWAFSVYPQPYVNHEEKKILLMMKGLTYALHRRMKISI